MTTMEHVAVGVALLMLVIFLGWKLKIMWGDEDVRARGTRGQERGDRRPQAWTDRWTSPVVDPVDMLSLDSASGRRDQGHGTTQAEDEREPGRVMYESLARAEGGDWQKWRVLPQKAQRSFGLAAQAVLDARAPTVGAMPVQELCTCGHFEIAHALEAPYACQHGFVADRKSMVMGVEKIIKGRPSSCGCKHFALPGAEKKENGATAGGPTAGVPTAGVPTAGAEGSAR